MLESEKEKFKDVETVKWQQEEVSLKRITEELGRSPKRNEFDKLSKYSHNAYKRAFGSFGKAVLAIGGMPAYLRNCTKEDVLSEIKRIYLETKLVPTVKMFDQLSKIRYQTARNLTKDQTWAELLIEAGITKPTNE